jgi:hypothetical protein
MKVLWFMPLTFAGGAEGFALFAPYLITVLCVLYFARVYREHRRSMPGALPSTTSTISVLPEAQPAF